MRIVITPEAVDYVRRHSGVAFIWASESGFLHTDIEPPNADAEWGEHGAAAFKTCTTAGYGDLREYSGLHPEPC